VPSGSRLAWATERERGWNGDDGAFRRHGELVRVDDDEWGRLIEELEQDA